MKDDDDRADPALIALRRILRATEIYERELAQAAGLTPAKLRVLQLLSASETASATPTDLAHRMGVSQATVTALVDQLEDRGLVRRERSQTDRRQTHVVMTEAGADQIRLMPDGLQQQFVHAFKALAGWEQAQLVASLERVATMLNASDLDAAPVLASGDIRKRPTAGRPVAPDHP